MIRVIEQLKLKNLRPFTVTELRHAARAWSRRSGTFLPKTNYGRAAFLRYARGWLRFHGKLIEARKWNEPLDNRVELYRRYLCVEKAEISKPRYAERNLYPPRCAVSVVSNAGRAGDLRRADEAKRCAERWIIRRSPCRSGHARETKTLLRSCRDIQSTGRCRRSPWHKRGRQVG